MTLSANSIQYNKRLPVGYDDSPITARDLLLFMDRLIKGQCGNFTIISRHPSVVVSTSPKMTINQYLLVLACLIDNPAATINDLYYELNGHDKILILD